MAINLVKKINFPADLSCGEVYSRDPGAGFDEMWFVSMPAKTLTPGSLPDERFASWKKVGPGCGSCTVPLADDVGLRVWADPPLDIGRLHTLDSGDLAALDLSYTGVTDDGIAVIPDITASVKNLDLSFTFVTGKSASDLSRLKHLEILHLAFLKMQKTSLGLLGAAEKIRVLNVMGAGITEPDSSNLTAISEMASLEVLDVSFNAIRDRDLLLFRSLAGLRILNLAHTEVTDEGLSVLKEMPALRRLYLGRNTITDRGVAFLSEINGLRSLSLSSPEITDKSIDHLSGMRSLKKLFIRGTGISRKGTREVSKHLPECEIDDSPGEDVRSGNFTGTRITDMLFKDLVESGKR